MSRVLWYKKPRKCRRIVAFEDGSKRWQRVLLGCQRQRPGRRPCSRKVELRQLETKSIAYRRHCGGTHRLLLGFTIRTERVGGGDGPFECAVGVMCDDAD